MIMKKLQLQATFYAILNSYEIKPVPVYILLHNSAYMWNTIRPINLFWCWQKHQITYTLTYLIVSIFADPVISWILRNTWIYSIYWTTSLEFPWQAIISFMASLFLSSSFNLFCANISVIDFRRIYWNCRLFSWID